MPVDIKAPILIYIEKKGCPACGVFQKEWPVLKKKLYNKVRMVKFVCGENIKAPPCLEKLLGWYPTILLIGPKSYFKCFTVKDEVNRTDYVPGYTLFGQRYNEVEENGSYRYAYRPNTADAIYAWYERVKNDVISQDEITPPKLYRTEFS